MIIGIKYSWEIYLHKSNPLSSGKLISSKVISGWKSLKIFLASLPVNALRTEYPSALRADVRISLMDISSSITNIFFA